MSLIWAQQIILLITDKSRGCSSALLSHAEEGAQQESITLESELGNVADHTQAAAAMNQGVTLFKTRAAVLVSHHWEMVTTVPMNTHGTGSGNGPRGGGGASVLGVRALMASTESCKAFCVSQCLGTSSINT